MALCDFSFCFPSNNVSILESFMKKKYLFYKYTYIYSISDIDFGPWRGLVRTLFLRYNRITLKVPRDE